MSIKIVWEQWKDPFENDNDFDDEEFDDTQQMLPQMKHQKFLQTPIGSLPVATDSMAENIDFWIMHSNVGITKNMLQIINAIPGVETVEVFTKYRLRIGFTKSGLFNNSDVKYNIMFALQSYMDNELAKQLEDIPEPNKTDILKKIDNIDTKYRYWTMLILPNYNIECAVSNDFNKKYFNKVQKIMSTQELTNGKILQNVN